MTLDKDTVIIAALVAWFAREVYETVKGDTKENTKVTRENNIVLAKLEVQIELLNKTISRIPTIEQDLNVAHEKIRNVERRLERTEELIQP